MSNLTKTFKGLLAAGVVLGTMGLASVPAQANPNFNFSFSFGTQGRSYSPLPVQPRNCMTNQRISTGLSNQGYYNVRYIGETYYGYPEFQAAYNGWVYTMQVERCSGNVYNVQAVERVYVQPVPRPVPVWPRVYVEPRPFGGNSDIIYHRN